MEREKNMYERVRKYQMWQDFLLSSIFIWFFFIRMNPHWHIVLEVKLNLNLYPAQTSNNIFNYTYLIKPLPLSNNMHYTILSSTVRDTIRYTIWYWLYDIDNTTILHVYTVIGNLFRTTVTVIYLVWLNGREVLYFL